MSGRRRAASEVDEPKEPPRSARRTADRAPHEREVRQGSALDRLGTRDARRRNRDRDADARHEDDPDTESLFLGDLSAQQRGRTIYRSSTDDGPIQEYRDDAAGWWPH